jgi:acyl-homoserine lactone acylase PvdQ
LGSRGARQRQLLFGTTKLSRRDGEGVVLDVFVPKAYYGIQSLRAGVASAGLELTGTAMELDRILATWDGRADVDSVAMTIAFYLDRELPNGLPEPGIAISDDPSTSPELRPAQAGSSAEYVRAVEAVAELLTEKYGTVQKPWGEIHVISRPTGDFGVPGGCNSLRALLGTWRGWWDVPDVLDDDGIERGNFGSRTLRFTEFGRDGVTVRSLTITGQVPASEHPESPHVLDQSRLYARLEFKQFPLTLAEVTADAREGDHVNCNHAAVEILSELTARAAEAASVK